jgi:GntR family transcriptional regulator
MLSADRNQQIDGRKSDLVRDRVLAMLEERQVGEAIPAERKLAADLGVSRPTLRAVIDGLVREGMLLRRHGSGTFVADRKLALPLTMTSFSEDMTRRGMVPGSRVLAFDVTLAGAKLGNKLRVSPSAEVYTIRRLRLADDEPMAIESLTVPRKLLPDLGSKDLERASFYTLLAQHGVTIAAGVQTIEPTVTSEQESEVLGVPLHSPAFLFERVSESSGEEVVEFVRSVYRGDRYRLISELRQPGR